ncbi:MAG: hypothetical protein QOK15_1915 [Nocardioidaceae bacterium]|jgi:hypothetical protein|nr:hypothetical protein [Nocardioidaceae bacterium]
MQPTVGITTDKFSGMLRAMNLEGDANASDAESLWRRRSVPGNQAPVSVAFGRGSLSSVLHDRGPTSLLIGIELADGRRCTHERRGMSDPTGPALSSQSGGGSSRRASLDLFLSPLVPAGDNKILFAWPWLGITDQVMLLPTEAIRAAAANVVELWPWEPESQEPERQAAPPNTPADSWFSPPR